MSSKIVDKLRSPKSVNGNGHAAELDRKQSSRPEDANIGPNDIVIAVMGITGSGKSTFIQMMTGQEVKTSGDLASCTSEVALFSCALSHNSKLWLVDTPGFDDTKLSDMKVLETVATHLGEAYAKKIPLNGIIYLHRISDVRLQGSALKNLRMFRKLCGTDNLKSVVLATTMWSKVIPAEGEAREEELKTKDEFWGALIRKGCTLMRHSNDRKSARRIIDYIINLHQPVVLDIQKEMIDKNMNLDETGAGMEVEAELQEAKKYHKEEMAQIEIEKEEALAAKQYEYAKELGQLAHEHKLQLKQKEQESLALKMNFEELMMKKEKENRRAEQQIFELKLQHQADQAKHKQDEVQHAAEMELLKQNQALEAEKEKGRNEANLHRQKVEANKQENLLKLEMIKQEKEKDKTRMKHEKEIEERKTALAKQQLEAQAERDRQEREAKREANERKMQIKNDMLANERAAREEQAEQARQHWDESREERARDRENQLEIARLNAERQPPCMVM